MSESLEIGIDVAVVGAGIAGSAAAWACTRRAKSVAVFEQFELGHVRGSSHGRSRIFRFAYDDPDYVWLAQAALPLWREVEVDLGDAVLETTGGLDIGPPENIEPIATALDSVGAPYQYLTIESMRERFPAYALPEGWQALFQADAGVVNADAARLGLIETARRRGAAVFERTKVLSIERGSDGVVVRTESGSHRARHVVVAAAGWSNELLAPLGLEVSLTVTREQVLYFGPQEERFVPSIWHASGATPELYGLPNGDGVKVGEHGTGPVVDPNTEGDVDPARLTRAEELTHRYLPGLRGSSIGAETCLYAVSPDDDFLLERFGPIVVACGFGGHGFKFGPMIGEMVADMIEGKPIRLAGRFARSRFQPV